MKCIVLTLLVHDPPEDHNYRHGLVSFSSLAAKTNQNRELSCCHSSSMRFSTTWALCALVQNVQRASISVANYGQDKLKDSSFCVCESSLNWHTLAGMFAIAIWVARRNYGPPSISHIQKRSKHLQCPRCWTVPRISEPLAVPGMQLNVDFYQWLSSGSLVGTVWHQGTY